MLFFPNTKINIGLNVIKRRTDGYHDIETVFCPVGLCDVLEFVPLPENHKGSIHFSSSGIAVNCKPEQNLCVKAYELLASDFDLPSVEAHLHKVVPSGAGLGGGSSDAAFMLKNLSAVFGLQLDEDTLCRYASRLGADCAFFIKNRPLFGYGKGDQFKEVQGFPANIEILTIYPGIHVSTAEAYGEIHPSVPAESLEKLITLPVKEWKNKIKNDFENHIFQIYPEIGKLKSQLYDMGASYASMSGSGSAVYGIFEGTAPESPEQFQGMFSWKGPVIKTQ